MTTIKVDTRVRDQVAEVAAEDFGGATFNETLKRLVREHRQQKVLQEYARLQEDPEEWASYMAEVEEFERTGLVDLKATLEDE